MLEKNCDFECKAADHFTPVMIYNPAALSKIAYRIGTHGRFKAQMLADIASQAVLSKLTTRADNDLSIAIFDSWASIADVLSFYQERIANEGFLRSATERSSVLQLARSIGYELRPGVAARTYLAFTMEASSGSPEIAAVEAGTKVQSVPGQNELPQVFETVEEIDARRGWSMTPQTKKAQDIFVALKEGKVYFDGTATKLKEGDGLLFVAGEEPIAFRLVQKVEVQPKENRTYVILVDAVPIDSGIQQAAINRISVAKQKQDPGITNNQDIIDSDSSFTRGDLERLLGKTDPWTESELRAHADLNGWSVDSIVRAINSEAEKYDNDISNAINKVDGVYAFRTKCGVFGSNAPLWESLPPEQRYEYKREGFDEKIQPPYKDNWDQKPVDVNTDYKLKTYGPGKIYLDNVYQEILAGDWVILRNSETSPVKTSAYKINATSEMSMNGFALTAKVTGLTLNNIVWRKIETSSPVKNTLDLNEFHFRRTTVYAHPEKVKLSKIPIEDPIEKDSVWLARMVGLLQEAKPIVVTGELQDQPGITKSEIAFLKTILHYPAKAQTLITLSDNLAYKYRRDTVELNANVAKATNGETKEEAVGSGDPTRRFQQFALKNLPLTYVPDTSPTGTSSTLEVRVDGIKWYEAESFENLSPSDNAYVTQRSNEGRTSIIFGDGMTGRLPSSGVENIKTRYRIGLGEDGNVLSNKLTLLMKRPLGIRSVTNPLDATGGTNPEELEDARKNAPRTVLTMDRIVSVQDYKNFAQSFAGIGKATSYVVRIGGADVVLVAVGSPAGKAISLDMHNDLVAAINSYKDPTARFIVRSFKLKKFKVKANLLIPSDRKFEDVKEEVKNALIESFSFKNRDFGQAVTLSELMAVIQGVKGVEAVDIDRLCVNKEVNGVESEDTSDNGYAKNLCEDGDVQSTQPPPQIIRADPVKEKGMEEEEEEGADKEYGVPIPSLLLIDPDGIDLREMSSQL